MLGSDMDCCDMHKSTTIHISLSILVDFGIQPEQQSVKVKTFQNALYLSKRVST